MGEKHVGEAEVEILPKYGAKANLLKETSYSPEIDTNLSLIKLLVTLGGTQSLGPIWPSTKKLFMYKRILSNKTKTS